MQERYEAEWIAEASAFRDRKLKGMLFALQLRKAARRLALDLARKEKQASLDVVGVVKLSEEAIAKIVAGIVERTTPAEPRWTGVRRDWAILKKEITVSDGEIEKIVVRYERTVIRGKRGWQPPSGASVIRSLSREELGRWAALDYDETPPTNDRLAQLTETSSTTRGRRGSSR